MEDIESLKYPAGKFVTPEKITSAMIDQWISELESLPEKLSKIVSPLTNDQLQTPYREGGWTIRQVVHHLADSHAQGFFRFKLALTEDHPTIKTYHEDLWAQCFDSTMVSIKPSLRILEGIHQRWTLLMHSMTDKDWKMTYFHPERRRDYPLDEIAGLYAWHGRHHYRHIQDLLLRQRWL